MEMLARSVVIHLLGQDNSQQVLSAVYKIVQEYPGRCPLFFQIDTGQGCTVAIQASGQMKVQPSSAFCGRMNALLGIGRVEIIGPNGPVGRPAIQNGLQASDEQVEEAVAQDDQ